MHLSKIKFVLFDVFIRYEYILKEAWRIYISIPDTWVSLLYYVCNTSFLFNTLESGILLLFKTSTCTTCTCKTCTKFFSKLKISFSTICEINTCSTRFIIYSYSAVQYSTAHYRTVQLITVQYSTVSKIQYSLIQYSTVTCITVQ